MEALRIVSSKHSVDGKYVSVTIETNRGPLEFGASTAALGTIIQEIAAAIWEARKVDKDAGVRSIPSPRRAQAQSTKDSRGVVLRFEMPNRLEHLFALPASQARDLQVQLQRSLADQS